LGFNKKNGTRDSVLSQIMAGRDGPSQDTEALKRSLASKRLPDCQFRGEGLMSLCKPPTMTPKRLAANAANAKKSTGPRTFRGKIISSRFNGRKGGRPPLPGSPAFLFRECQAAGRVWGPGDPGFLRLYLAELKKQSPSTYAMAMRINPEYQKILDMG
jgi:hypothetical protein